jgi:hypothetical protein
VIGSTLAPHLRERRRRRRRRRRQGSAYRHARVREFGYVAGAERALARSYDAGWTVVSMRDDWATVF